MPELPEVENFRRLLLPLVSSEHPLVLERCSLEKAPPRKFITDDEISDVRSRKMVVEDVVRKGKLICMILTEKQRAKAEKECKTKYLFLHMGMTGRISNPQCIPKLQELSDTEIYPPPYTYLRLTAGSNEACFSDPRKFGAVLLKDSLDEDFDVLAPDAWTGTYTPRIKIEKTDLEHGAPQVPVDESTVNDILTKLTGQSMGIKGVLLDQKRAVCGVGNWVADEILYQEKMHPDQNFLTKEEAKSLLQRLHVILDKAVHCLYNDQDFPHEWLFHFRWSKRKKTAVTDAHGRSIAFVTSGGRTSAIVPSIQKKKSRKSATTESVKDETKSKKPVPKKKRAVSKTKSDLEVKPLEAVSEGRAKKAKLDSNETPKNKNRREKDKGSRKTASRTALASRTGSRRSPRLTKL